MMRRSVSLVLAIVALVCFGFGQSDTNGLADLQARAEKGEAVAQFLLGRAYLFASDGLKKDEATAVVWFRKAADQGQKNSETFLGWMYEEGRGGLAKDDTQAAVWYRKAADQGEANAMRNLGLMCLDGRGGFAKDEVQGVSWFRKAAEKDDESAENYLGLMYEKGRGGLPQDVTQAIFWYRKAADKGYASAQNNLAVLYLGANPDLRNPRAALDYAQKAVAAFKYNPVFLSTLGRSLLCGRTVRKGGDHATTGDRDSPGRAESRLQRQVEHVRAGTGGKPAGSKNAQHFPSLPLAAGRSHISSACGSATGRRSPHPIKRNNSVLERFLSCYIRCSRKASSRPERLAPQAGAAKLRTRLHSISKKLFKRGVEGSCVFSGKPQDFSTRAKTRRSLEMTLISGYTYSGTGLASQWWFVSLVDLHLVAGDETVGFIGHADNRLQLLEHGVRHALAARRHRVRCDAIAAAVGDAYGHVEQFLGERIERPRRHDLLDAFPCAFQRRRIVRDGLPEIVYPVGLAKGHDVVVNGANLRARVLIFNQSEC